MLQTKNFQPRQYQEAIFLTIKQYNTLVVLETGLGKTSLALMLSLHHLQNDLTKKIIILAPSRPLISQHHRYFLHHSTLDPVDLALVTGKIPPPQRKALYKQSLIILSTPQCINNDLINSLFSLENISLIVFDEAHHAIQNYSYVNIARLYKQQSTNPHILALTASPGNTKEKIKEICNNLLIEKTEIRTEKDEDVKPYIKDKQVSWFTIDLDEPLLNIISKIKQFHTSKLRDLKHLGITKPINLINKRDLLDIQSRFRQQLQQKNPIAFHAISLASQLIKTSHLIDTLETQGISTALKYIKKLESESTKASSIILNNQNIKLAISSLNSIKDTYTHPKIRYLSSIIQEQLLKNKDSKIIIFINFRDTIDEILKEIKNLPHIKPTILIGQKQGLSQKAQIQTIRDFENNLFNVLLCTSIGEEGLSIKSATTAIFYDSTASEIRDIQRAGRVARIQSGKIIFLLTNNTREIGYYWASKKKENTMKKTLKKMQEKNLENFV